jgi:hypothetical protein
MIKRKKTKEFNIQFIGNILNKEHMFLCKIKYYIKENLFKIVFSSKSPDKNINNYFKEIDVFSYEEIDSAMKIFYISGWKGLYNYIKHFKDTFDDYEILKEIENLLYFVKEKVKCFYESNEVI